MITIDQEFDNGSVGQVTRLGDDWYHIGLRPDTWYWTHFRVRGCRGKHLTFSLTYYHHPQVSRWGTVDTGNPERPDYSCRSPYVSYDTKTWHHVESAEKVAQMPDTVKFSHTFTEEEAYICYTIPYTYTDLLAWLDSLQTGSAAHDVSLVQVDVIGKTEQGRDVPMVTVGEPMPDKPVIMFVSREDGDEPTSNVAIEGLVARMTDPTVPEMKTMLERVFFRIVPMTAIEAVVMGNPYGGKYYMAREWFRDPPLPEIAAVKRVVEDCFANHPVQLMGKLHGGQTYDNPPVWDFRVFDTELRKLIPSGRVEPDEMNDVWNPFLRDATPWVRELTIFESYLQQTYDFWPFFSTHTNGKNPANLREQGGRFADLLAKYVERTIGRDRGDTL